MKKRWSNSFGTNNSPRSALVVKLARLNRLFYLSALIHWRREFFKSLSNVVHYRPFDRPLGSFPFTSVFDDVLSNDFKIRTSLTGAPDPRP